MAAQLIIKLHLLEEAKKSDDLKKGRQAKQIRKFKTISRDTDFIHIFRLSEDLIIILENDLAPYMCPRIRSSGLTKRLKILCTLSFLANGSYQKIIGKNVDTYISQSSASRAIHEVVNALNNKNIISKYIRFPQNHNDRQVVKSRFYEKFKIPGVLGCVDGTLISMIRLMEHEERYYCRKGYHARNVLIINDADLNILHVDVTFGGATHDSFVFSNTRVKEHLENLITNEEKVYLLALGPILPQINVFGRQLGVSPSVMGMVTAVLPLLWAAAKPIFGYVVDFWPAHRKLVFMLLITIMTTSYCCLWFLPMPAPRETNSTTLLESVYRLNDTIYLKPYTNNTILEKYKCHWNCSVAGNFDVYLSDAPFINTVYIDNEVSNSSCMTLSMGFDDFQDGEVTCIPKEDCNLLCYENEYVIQGNKSRRSIENSISDNSLVDFSKNVSRVSETVEKKSNSFYMTGPFWAFVILTCVGTVAFNVANCIGDAVCFDVLGPDRGSKYGAQRAWGTAGYGLTALLGGYLIDSVSGEYKDFTPAFVVALAATAVDLYSCRALTLPSLSSPEDSGKALRDVLRIPKVMVFITFAVVAGTFDSFIIYYMFWFLEELAEKTGHTAKIKLIEGVVVAAQSFIGELLFFFFSGKIIKRFGYGTTLTVSLFCYGVRMLCISFIQNPWHLVFIESIMQGPTYALCYSTIVGYAAHVAPEGYSATVQGIVAGMDDGVGFAIGSLVGGQLYSWLGGRASFRVLAATAVIGSGLHAILFAVVSRSDKRKAEKQVSMQEATPEEGQKMLQEHSSAIYKDTTIPLNGEEKLDR